jgi:hypothetical protein
LDRINMIYKIRGSVESQSAMRAIVRIVSAILRKERNDRKGGEQIGGSRRRSEASILIIRFCEIHF